MAWFIRRLPEAIEVLIARSKTPAMEKYVELAEENRRLAAEVEGLRREKEQPWHPTTETPTERNGEYELLVSASWDGDVFMTGFDYYIPRHHRDILGWRPDERDSHDRK